MNPPLRLLGGLSLALLGTACVTERVVVREPMPGPAYRPAPVYQPPQPQGVISVFVDPPIGQPAPIGCPWAPPPMLVEVPPPPPFEEAVWTGGYWVWHGTWVWAHGRWSAPPQPSYVWRPPYYENRDGIVVFITGHWAPRGAVFVPPPPGLSLVVEVAGPGVAPGPRPLGPSGIFVPPPPGSRLGIIVPAPMGTPPAVVTSAPPVVNVGMRITNNINNGTIANTTNINNSRTTIINNVTNVTNVTIVAPPGATASGQAVNTSVPAQAHLAAALPALVRAPAPTPVSARPIPAFVHGQTRVDLPPPQAVRPVVPPSPPVRPVPPPRPNLAPSTRPVGAPPGSVQHPSAGDPRSARPVPEREEPAPRRPDPDRGEARPVRGPERPVRDEARHPEERLAGRDVPNPHPGKPEDKARPNPRAENRPKPKEDRAVKRERDPERERN